MTDGLDKAWQKKLVTKQEGPHGLLQFTYTDSCVFDRAWDDITILARGLIIDPRNQLVVATPFPKFFNLGERQDALPNDTFDVYDKVDGSLIILFHFNGEWITATKGSFYSEQAFWAREQVLASAKQLSPGYTYCLEAVYPENRIVVKYDHEGLYLLGAYDQYGYETSYTGMEFMAHLNGWRIPKRHRYQSLAALADDAASTEGIEGWVVRFPNGHRIKVKTDQYRRLHRLISRVTPLAVWEAMQAGDDLETWKRELPEEYWDDFEKINLLLIERYMRVMSGVDQLRLQTEHLTDKELGLLLPSINHPYKKLIFGCRKMNERSKGNERFTRAVYQEIRPTGNHLPGYQSSVAMNRVLMEC